MKYVLDTDHVSLLDYPLSTTCAVLVLNINLHLGEGVGVSVVTVHEQLLGAHTRINQSKDDFGLLQGYQLLSAIFHRRPELTIIPFDAAALAVYTDLKKQKVRISTMDLRIASIALAGNLILVTRNVADFNKVPNLRHVDWTK